MISLVYIARLLPKAPKLAEELLLIAQIAGETPILRKGNTFIFERIQEKHGIRRNGREQSQSLEISATASEGDQSGWPNKPG